MNAGGPADPRLRAVLGRSHELGFIGDPDLDAHVAHALGFAAVIGAAPRRALDLGSGGGLPGLVLACRWPTTAWTLLDGSPTRTEFLLDAVAELDLGDRAAVRTGRAEEVGRRPGERGGYDVVVARSFGPPAVLAECAAPFLEVGGRLVVSEPPATGPRWDHPAELAQLGLSAEAEPAVVNGATYQVLRQVAACPDRFPRRVGIPSKRPLFADP